jgi:hypothetical protein
VLWRKPLVHHRIERVPREDPNHGRMHPCGFTHDMRVEVSPHVEGSEPSEAQEWIDVRSGFTH